MSINRFYVIAVIESFYEFNAIIAFVCIYISSAAFFFIFVGIGCKRLYCFAVYGKVFSKVRQ
ncbi:hypothetical protein FWJ32_05380 [Calorimonas adulescens]|uniref:Uncharacterized protein n=1 Tax=Calorimonas adulescens TaxID=2606906 RepID=A0A5D8QCR9_9THEO|nr:hypothetical protein FWJ32_05380 [Calorimonas adulescens]